MVRLVDDLLDVSRITRSKLGLRLERVELASVIHQSIEVCRPLVERAKHELTSRCRQSRSTCTPTRCGWLRYSAICSKRLQIHRAGWPDLAECRAAGPNVVVHVKDTGVGIAPDKLASVFEMFTQIDRSLERSQGGLGIGLTLVKRLVEIHGGSVEAHSEGKAEVASSWYACPCSSEKSSPRRRLPNRPDDGPPHPHCR